MSGEHSMEKDIIMRIPRSCIYTEFGYVLLDDKNKRAYRVLNRDSYDFVSSKAYKQQEGMFWPTIIDIDASSINNNLIKDNKNLKVVEVEYLEHVIYWTEMSFLDIKQSLLFLCNISNYLAKNNIYMVSHLWNVTLNKGKPLLIDLGDFKKGVNLIATYNTITSTLSEKVTHHIPEGYQSSRWIKNYKYITRELSEIRKSIGTEIQDADTLTSKVASVISKIEIKQEHIHWDTYPVQKNMPNTLRELFSYAPSNRPNLCKVLKSKKPKTLLDLGCSYGLYSLYASLFGTKTMGLDYSHHMISEANSKASRLGLDCSFGFVDLLNSKQWGLNGVYGSYSERLKSEAVIAPALLHHMHGRGVPLEVIIQEWLSCAEKWIMVEHIPNDTTGKVISSEKIIETFKKGGFTNITILDSRPAPRKWILGEK